MMLADYSLNNFQSQQVLRDTSGAITELAVASKIPDVLCGTAAF